MSMLDRPISEFDGPVDSVRVPVVPPTGECKPFQEVLIELAGRLKFPAFVQRRRLAQVQRLSGLHRQLRDRAGLGHRLPRRLARRGRRPVPQGRAESEAVGEVRRQQLRLPLQAAAVVPVHAQLEQGLHGVGAARADAALRRADPDPALFGSAADVPPRRAGQAAGPAAAGASARAHRALCRSAAVLLCAAGDAGDRSRPLSAQRRSRSGRWRCTTRGIRRTPGCARSTATTTCS